MKKYTCEGLADFLLDYLEGRIKGEELEIFEKHLNICTACIQYMDQYKQTVELCGEAWRDCEQEEEIPERLVEAILAARAAGAAGEANAASPESPGDDTAAG